MGQTGNGGFCTFFSYFFRISTLEGFLYFVAPQGDRKCRVTLQLLVPQRRVALLRHLQRGLHDGFPKVGLTRWRAMHTTKDTCRISFGGVLSFRAFLKGGNLNFQVPEGHHPRGTTLREALRGNLLLRGLCGGLSEGSAGSLLGFCGVSAGVRGIFRGFSGVVTLCL